MDKHWRKLGQSTTVSRKRDSAGKMAAAILELQEDASQKPACSTTASEIDVQATKPKKARQNKKKKTPKKKKMHATLPSKPAIHPEKLAEMMELVGEDYTSSHSTPKIKQPTRTSISTTQRTPIKVMNTSTPNNESTPRSVLSAKNTPRKQANILTPEKQPMPTISSTSKNTPKKRANVVTPKKLLVPESTSTTTTTPNKQGNILTTRKQPVSFNIQLIHLLGNRAA